MDLRFFIDPETDEPHIYQHEVSEDEVENVLRNPAEDWPGRKDSRIAIGQTGAGRYVQVIYSPDPGRRSAFVITAYELTGKPLVAFKRRQRKKRQRR